MVVQYSIYIIEPDRRWDRSVVMEPTCARHYSRKCQTDGRVEKLRFGQNSSPTPQIEETRGDANGRKPATLVAVQYILIQPGPSHVLDPEAMTPNVHEIHLGATSVRPPFSTS